MGSQGPKAGRGGGCTDKAGISSAVGGILL